MIRSLSILLIAVLAVACGGSSGGGSASEGGIGGSGITRGAITSTNSAVVAGTDFDVQPADDAGMILIERVDVPQTALALGMTARIEGDRDPDGLNGTADVVEVDDAIEGPIEMMTPDPIDPDTTEEVELMILGQSVEVERGFTVLDGVIFDDLEPGQVVEVFGFRDGDGDITATRLEFVSTDPTPEVELKGVVSNLDTSGAPAVTFEIGSILVMIDENTTDLPDGTPMDDDFVEVEGVFDGTDTIDATTANDRVELEEPDAGDADDFQIEGIVSQFVSLADFLVDGQPVDAGNFAVDFEPNSSAFVANGARVEVEGDLQDGVVIAAVVRLRGGEALVAAEVDVVADGNGVLTLLGDIDVIADGGTRFDDEDDDCNGMTELTSLSDLAVGDFVEVRGVWNGAELVATEVQCDDDADELEVRGPLNAFNGPALTFDLLGLEITVNDPGTQFEDFPVSVSNTAEFFAFLASNPDSVLIASDEDDGDATRLETFATKVEFEDDDD